MWAAARKETAGGGGGVYLSGAVGLPVSSRFVGFLRKFLRSITVGGHFCIRSKKGESRWFREAGGGDSSSILCTAFFAKEGRPREPGGSRGRQNWNFNLFSIRSTNPGTTRDITWGRRRSVAIVWPLSGWGDSADAMSSCGDVQ